MDHFLSSLIGLSADTDDKCLRHLTLYNFKTCQDNISCDPVKESITSFMCFGNRIKFTLVAQFLDSPRLNLSCPRLSWRLQEDLALKWDQHVWTEPVTSGVSGSGETL